MCQDVFLYSKGKKKGSSLQTVSEVFFRCGHVSDISETKKTPKEPRLYILHEPMRSSGQRARFHCLSISRILKQNTYSLVHLEALTREKKLNITNPLTPGLIQAHLIQPMCTNAICTLFTPMSATELFSQLRNSKVAFALNHTSVSHYCCVLNHPFGRQVAFHTVYASLAFR